MDSGGGVKPTPIRRHRRRYETLPGHWREARRDRCEVCGSYGQYLTQHHVVYQQHVRDAGGDLWDVRNSLTLCDGMHGCHGRHHNRMRPVRLTVLPDVAFEFAVELLGTGPAYEYLRRRYLGSDPRLDALLSAWEEAA